MARVGGLSFYEKESKFNKAFVIKIFEILGATLVAVFLAFTITYVFGCRTTVIGESMSPGIVPGDEILINRFVYMISSAKKGDVVVFLPYGNTNTHYYVKRVVALPGDTVQIIDGRLYVNGYVSEPEDEYDYMVDSGIAINPLTLGTDEYFVLGDDRNNSEDSRSGNIGPVPSRNIIGKAWLLLPNDNRHVTLIR